MLCSLHAHSTAHHTHGDIGGVRRFGERGTATGGGGVVRGNGDSGTTASHTLTNAHTFTPRAPTSDRRGITKANEKAWRTRGIRWPSPRVRTAGSGVACGKGIGGGARADEEAVIATMEAATASMTTVYTTDAQDQEYIDDHDGKHAANVGAVEPTGSILSSAAHARGFFREAIAQMPRNDALQRSLTSFERDEVRRRTRTVSS